MSLRSNFKQAINDLSSSGPKAESVTEQESSSGTSSAQAYDRPASTGNSEMPAARTFAETGRVASTQLPLQSSQPPAAPIEKQNIEAAIITADTQIHGAIVTKSPLVIKGKVKGNILCEETVRLTGEIEGNVTAMSIEAKDASIKGDLRMKHAALFDNGTLLNGNLDADSAVINGTVNGDMRISGNLNILQNSRINGDIVTGSLEIAKGAIISGKVSVGVADEKPQKPAEPTAAQTPTPAAVAKPAQTAAPSAAPAKSATSSNPAAPSGNPKV